MAAPKKATTKKRASTTKTAAAKKPTKKPVKQTATRAKAKSKPTTTVRRKQPASAQMQSFVPMKSPRPFFQVKIGEQTVYWAVLALAIFALGLWVLSLNLRVHELYNEIDQANLDASRSVITEDEIEAAKAKNAE
jgi:hypothetical protein